MEKLFNKTIVTSQEKLLKKSARLIFDEVLDRQNTISIRPMRWCAVHAWCVLAGVF